MKQVTCHPRDFGRVAVLMGGTSSEREISLRGGAEVLSNLLKAGVDAFAVDVGRDAPRQLLDTPFDCVFNVLHGGAGENGEIQSVLSLLGKPYTGSGVLASALALDKLRSKLLWKGLSLPTPAWRTPTSLDDCRQAVVDLGLPLMVKPSLEGSSVGISKVEKVEELASAWTTASQYGPVIAETFIAGKEVTASIVGREVLPLISMSTPRVFYDYEAKYHANDTHYECPAQLPQAVTEACQKLALEAFDALGANGWGRVDMMLDEQLQPWLIELNTVPGMTDHSLVPMAARAANLELPDLMLQILAATCLPDTHEVGGEQ